MSSISVIIPTWNRAATITAAIESALVQTYPVAEVLVCDDGSSDDTQKRVEAIIDPRVRWLPGTRGGRPAIPRNRGAQNAKGEWLAFLDSDDEWLPTKIEHQLALIKSSGCLAACGNAYRRYPGGGLQEKLLTIRQNRLTLDDLLDVNMVICSSALIQRELFQKVGGFPEDAALRAIEDYALWLRVITQSPFAYDPEPRLFYRDDPSTSIRANDSDEWRQRQRVFSNAANWARSRPSHCIVSYSAFSQFRTQARTAKYKLLIRQVKRKIISIRS